MRLFKISLLILFFSLSVAISSCGILSNSNNPEDSKMRDSVLTELTAWWPTVEQIVGNVGGRSAEVFSTTDTNYVTKKCDRLIALNIDSCAFTMNGSFSKYQVASYCATQLFMKLDSQAIASHDAINIVFDNSDPGALFDSREYYFIMSELDSACSAFELIANYLNAINNNDYQSAGTMIDANYFDLDPAELHVGVKTGIDNKPFLLFNCYEHYDYISKDSSESFKCFAIFTGLNHSNNIYTSFSFMIPMDFADKKIINYRLPSQ